MVRALGYILACGIGLRANQVERGFEGRDSPHPYSISSSVNQDVGEVKSPCYLTTCMGYFPNAMVKYPGTKGILRRTRFILDYSF